MLFIGSEVIYGDSYTDLLLLVMLLGNFGEPCPLLKPHLNDLSSDNTLVKFKRERKIPALW